MKLHKVWGWVDQAPPGHPARAGGHRQIRCCSTYATLAELARRANVSVYFLRTYGSRTGNLAAVEAANEMPGVILARGLDDQRGPYLPLEEL